ncbi:MAG: DNA-processing protein DprA [Candidatus Omnitrophica bacterium]|nr:DNA-processing protein DprA [Candidatus Omnitrophota bacterium]MCM8777406.1 DNA-processing protein DprA [Candidatus Omnitrophota bacterium]
MEDRKKFWVCAILAGLGPTGTKKLLEIHRSIDKIFTLSLKELKESGIPSKTAENITMWEKLPWKEEIRFCEENNISLVSLEDPSYPCLLKKIHNPPVLLYVKGTLPSDNDICLAIVGTRNPSIYGMRMAEKFAEQLSLYGVVIVSGMARGIDTAAHKGALKADCKTIAVVGCGMRYCYPAENFSLSNEIAKTGAVITEFPSYIKPKPENFPQRNRIISGMCRGIIVVEAGQKSGALITANLALEQGRDVFAIPGRVDDFTSKGTNQLLKEGAILVENVGDILEALNLEIKKEEKKKEEDVSCLSEREKIILNRIPSGEKVSFEEILMDTGIEQHLIFQSLLSLITKGLIFELPGKFYTRK